jgi:acylphosphatase
MQQDLTATLTGHPLDEVAKKRGLSVVETPFFAADEPVRGAEDYTQFPVEAFKLKDGEVRALTEGPEPYLVKLVARNVSAIPPLADVKDLARKAYVRVEAEKKAQQIAQDMIKQIKSPDDLQKVAEQNHLTVAKTGDFPRASRAIPGIGEVSGLIPEAFAKPQLPGVINRVMQNGGNSYIFEVSSRMPPDPADWKIQGPAFTDKLLEQRRAAAWIEFINGLKSKADIVIHTELIGPTQS